MLNNIHFGALQVFDAFPVSAVYFDAALMLLIGSLV